MRSTFCPNRILERQSSHNRETGLKFSSKRENSALSIKTLQNALLRSCAKIAFASVKVLKIVTLASNSFQNGKTVRSSWKLYKTHFSGHAQHVLAKSHFWASKFSKSSHWPFSLKRENSALSIKIVQDALFRSCGARFGQIAFLRVKVLKIVKLASNSLQNAHFAGHTQHVFQIAFCERQSSRGLEILFKTGKQCAFHENCTKRSFQVMRKHVLAKSHFGASKFSKSSHWPLQILFKTVFKNQFAFLSVKDFVKHENGLYKTLFSGHAEHVLAKSHFWESKFSKSWNWPQILFKTGKQCALHTKLYKTHFSGHAQDVSAKSHFGASKFSKLSRGLEILFKTWKQCAFQNVQNALFRSCGARFAKSHFGASKFSKSSHWPKFSSKRENSALSIYKTLRSCAARFGQIQFASVKVLKIVTLASNSFQYGKTVRSSWKLYKTHFSGHAQHVLAKSHLRASKFSKSSHWPNILFKTGKQCAFYENCTKRSFQVMRSTFWPNRIFESQRASNSLQNGKTVLKIVIRSFRPNRILERQSSKSSRGLEILFKTGKQCAFHENCTKRSFQVMPSTFWPNRICERQSSQNRHTGLKFSSKRENTALSIKIVQNALFRWCGARFGQFAFLSVKDLEIVKLSSNSL